MRGHGPLSNASRAARIARSTSFVGRFRHLQEGFFRDRGNQLKFSIGLRSDPLAANVKVVQHMLRECLLRIERTASAASRHRIPPSCFLSAYFKPWALLSDRSDTSGYIQVNISWRWHAEGLRVRPPLEAARLIEFAAGGDDRVPVDVGCFDGVTSAPCMRFDPRRVAGFKWNAKRYLKAICRYQGRDQAILFLGALDAPSLETKNVPRIVISGVVHSARANRCGSVMTTASA